jgi:chromosome partitioning protein
LCPFSYDEFSFDSTILFSVVLKKINKDVPVFFVPNRVKGNVKYETQTEVEHQLIRFGSLTAAISDRVDFQRTSTFQTPLVLYPIILPVFEKIYESHIGLSNPKPDSQ